MADDLVVRQKKSEPRCKFCKTPYRAELDHLLMLRSQRKGIDGVPVTEAYVSARAIELGVENPTHENLTKHWRNHCELVKVDEEAEVEKMVKSILAEIKPEDLKNLTAADRLELLEMQGFVELQARLITTGKTGITIDQLIRINELKQRQKSNEDQRRFLGALGAGLSEALSAAARRPLLPEPPRPAHPTIEAEVVSE